MRHLSPIEFAWMVLVVCAGAQWVPTSAGAAEGEDKPKEFVPTSPEDAAKLPAKRPSKLKPTLTEAVLKFVVIDKDKGPVKGIAIALAGADGKKYYADETDAEGYAEVLVPVGQKYDIVYLSLGRKDIAASTTVSDEPKQNIRLTLRYMREKREAASEPRFVLSGVNFDNNKATIRPESFSRLDSVVEFMAHKKSARIEISGHTDNVGNLSKNKLLSEKRAQACRTYLMSKGIDGSRIKAVGYGDERPIVPNDTAEGRQKNRRIEATEL